jgi:uncharacterized protein YndB with AHSA1/START domain
VAATDRFLPQADETVTEHLVVAADSARTYAAIGRADISSDRFVGLVGGLDDARVRLAGESPAPRTLDRLLAADVGPVELSAEPGVRRVIGVAGHYNAAERGVAHLRAEDFDTFDAPGSLKAVVEFTLTPQDGGRTLLGCEVRVRATDEDMRSTLGMTWFAVRVGLGLAVRRLLAAIRAEAEGGSGAKPAQDSDTDGDHDDAGDLHPA